MSEMFDNAIQMAIKSMEDRDVALAEKIVAGDEELNQLRFHIEEVGFSTMATQLSAISFVSAPAFVGLKLGGGMKWLTFEFAVPLAMLFIMIFVIPPLFRSGVVSIYEFVELRFGLSLRAAGECFPSPRPPYALFQRLDGIFTGDPAAPLQS